jgi:hypothetical protein
MGVKEIPSVRNGLGVSIVSTPKGVMSDANMHALPMSAAKCFAPCSEEGSMSRIGKKTRHAGQRHLCLDQRPDHRSEGPERHPFLHRGRRCHVIAIEGDLVKVTPRGLSKRARQQWGMTRSMIENLVTGVSTGFKKETGNPGRRLPCLDAGQHR